MRIRQSKIFMLALENPKRTSETTVKLELLYKKLLRDNRSSLLFFVYKFY